MQSRKDIVQIFVALLQRKIGVRQPTVEYVRTHPAIVEAAFRGCVAALTQVRVTDDGAQYWHDSARANPVRGPGEDLAVFSSVCATSHADCPSGPCTLKRRPLASPATPSRTCAMR